MKNLISFLFLLFLPAISFSQNLKALDKKYGFRDVTFEMPFDSLASKHLVESEENFYTSSTEDLKMGEYSLGKISYYFYKGQLSLIVIEPKGYINSHGFLKIIQEGYGRGYQGNPYIENYYWFGKKVTLTFDINSVTNDALVIIRSNKLNELEKAGKKLANEKAAKKL